MRPDRRGIRGGTGRGAGGARGPARRRPDHRVRRLPSARSPLPEAIAAASPARLEELCRIVVAKVVVRDREVQSIEWTPPARPFFGRDSGGARKGAWGPARCLTMKVLRGTWRERLLPAGRVKASTSIRNSPRWTAPQAQARLP
jgi:hypothetical protein